MDAAEVRKGKPSRWRVSSGASNGHREQLSFSIGRKTKTSINIIMCEIGKVSKDVVTRHSRGHVLEHFVNRDPQSANAWFATTLARFHGNDVAIVHELTPELII